MNTYHAELEGLRDPFHELQTRAARLSAFPEAREVSARLAQAEDERKQPLESARPLVFTLLGSTGVGKSSLFNALLDHAASPVSNVERCYTRRPHVALSAAARPLVAFLEKHDPVWVTDVPADLPAVLIDTPDIDGMNHENWDTTRAVVQEADVVIFVTDPDRRANLAPLAELARWAGRKHWIFVLNKADLLQNRDAVRDDFDRRLRQVGFEPSAHHRLVLSVHGPDHLDLDKLRTMIFTPTAESDRQAVWMRNLLGRYQHALFAPLFKPFRTRAEELRQLEREHLASLRETYRAGLSLPVVTDSLRNHLRNRTWLAVAGQGAALLSPALWLRARFATLSQSFAIARLTRGSLIGLAAAAGVAVLEAARSLQALRRCLDLMGPQFREQLEAVKRKVRRQLEDRGLASLAAPATTLANAEPTTDETESRPATLAAGPFRIDVPISSGLTRTLEQWGLLSAEQDEVLLELHDHTERLAADNARAALGWFPVILGNLLPLAALLHILYRIGRSWFDASYLPLPFYLMALAVFATSCLPGYWLVAARVRKRCRTLDLDDLVNRIQHPPATLPLRQVEEELGRFAQLRDQLADDLTRRRASLSVEASGSPFAVLRDQETDAFAIEPPAMSTAAS